MGAPSRSYLFQDQDTDSLVPGAWLADGSQSSHPTIALNLRSCFSQGHSPFRRQCGSMVGLCREVLAPCFHLYTKTSLGEQLLEIIVELSFSLCPLQLFLLSHNVFFLNTFYINLYIPTSILIPLSVFQTHTYLNNAVRMKHVKQNI